MICKKKIIKYSVQQLENKNLVDKKKEKKKKRKKGGGAGYDNHKLNCSRNEVTSKIRHFIYFYPCQKRASLFLPPVTYVVPLKQGKRFSTSPIMSIFHYFHISVQYLIYLKALQL